MREIANLREQLQRADSTDASSSSSSSSSVGVSLSSSSLDLFDSPEQRDTPTLAESAEEEDEDDEEEEEEEDNEEPLESVEQEARRLSQGWTNLPLTDASASTGLVCSHLHFFAHFSSHLC